MYCLHVKSRRFFSFLLSPSFFFFLFSTLRTNCHLHTFITIKYSRKKKGEKKSALIHILIFFLFFSTQQNVTEKKKRKTSYRKNERKIHVFSFAHKKSHVGLYVCICTKSLNQKKKNIFFLPFPPFFLLEFLCPR